MNLADNQLSGCLPAVLRNAANDGLGDLALPYCDTLISASEKRAALIVLYWATNGANWTNRTNWLSDSPLGEWHGVTTDKAGRIVSLDLRGNQLSGAIPPEIGNLTDLRSLFLRDNQLSGCLPPSLHKVEHNDLARLGLSNCNTPTFSARRKGRDGCALRGGERRHLDRQHQLAERQTARGVARRYNRQHGTGHCAVPRRQPLEWGDPAELGNLTNLKILSLRDNRLSGTIPVELGELTNLTGLYLSANQLSGAIPAELGSLSNLRVLGPRIQPAEWDDSV